MHYENNSHRFGNCEVLGKFHRCLLRGKHRNFGDNFNISLSKGGRGVLRQTTCMSYFFVFGGIEFNPVTLTILTVMKIQASLSCDKLLHNF